tara:strand:- start:367 stop:570 length:204 start_codon:yes stop_codon:yes gene_type:complete
MFGPDYNTMESRMLRANMAAHYVKCDVCRWNNVCGFYAKGDEFCRYHHDDCAGGELVDGKVMCGYCY